MMIILYSYLWWVHLQYTDQSQGDTGRAGDFQSPESTWMPATADSKETSLRILIISKI